MGKFSAPISLIAVLWMSFATIVLLFPTTPSGIDASTNMNYTVVVLFGWILLCVAGYYASGANRWFRGPKSNLVEGEGVREGEEKRSESESGDEKVPI